MSRAPLSFLRTMLLVWVAIGVGVLAGGPVLLFAGPSYTPPTGGGGGGGGVTDHAALTSLDWGASGHIGTASRIAAFDAGGATTYKAIGTDIQAYDAQLTALEVKAKLDSKVYKNYKYLLDDFLHVRSVIDAALNSAAGDIEAASAYAEEETGEFMMAIPELEKQVALIKTITCVKGKTIKKVTALKAACPKGYVKKK